MIVGVAVLPIAPVPATLPFHDSGAWSCRMSGEEMEEASDALRKEQEAEVKKILERMVSKLVTEDDQIAYRKKHKFRMFRDNDIRLPVDIWESKGGRMEHCRPYWCTEEKRFVYNEEVSGKKGELRTSGMCAPTAGTTACKE